MKYLLMIAALCTSAAHAEEPKLTYKLSCDLLNEGTATKLVLSQYSEGGLASLQLTKQSGEQVVENLHLTGKYAVVKGEFYTDVNYQFPLADGTVVFAKSTKSMSFKEFCGRGSCHFMKLTASVTTPAESLSFPKCHEVFIP